MFYNNYADFDKSAPKLQLSVLAGINNPLTPSFFIYFSDGSVKLECLKLKFFGSHKVLSTYSIPFEKVITMNVVAEDNIDEIEKRYSEQLNIEKPLFVQTRDIINTLVRMKRPNSTLIQRIVVLSLVYYSATGEINDIVFSITNCGYDIAESMAKYLRAKIGIESSDKPIEYFQNSKGEYQL